MEFKVGDLVKYELGYGCKTLWIEREWKSGTKNQTAGVLWANEFSIVLEVVFKENEFSNGNVRIFTSHCVSGWLFSDILVLV